MKTIFRIEKQKNFTVISRFLLEDSRLSWVLRAILAYLLSKPDHWKLNVENLVNSGDLAKDAIYRRIKEGIKFGYISRKTIRGDNGRIIKYEYVIHEEPKKPFLQNAEVEQSSSKLPFLENQEVENTDNSKDSVRLNTENITTTTNTDVGSSDFIFHKGILNSQKDEIKKFLVSLDDQLAQDVLDELAGFIDKNLIQKDIVSLADGLVKKALKGEFNSRLGVRYKESRTNKRKIIQRKENSIKSVEVLPEVDLNNPLVKQVLNIKKGCENG